MNKLLLLLSSPNDMLYPVKFAVKKRLVKDDDDDGKCKYKVNLATQIVREERHATNSAVVSDFFDETLINEFLLF